MSKTAAKPNPFGNLTARTIEGEPQKKPAPQKAEKTSAKIPAPKEVPDTDRIVDESINYIGSGRETSANASANEQTGSTPSAPVGKTVSLNAGGIHIEANRKNIRSHRGSYSLSDKAYHNLVRLAELTNNSYNEIFNRLLEDIQIDDATE